MLNEKVLNEFKQKNVLITGGTGLIGRVIVDRMVQAGANVRIVSLDDISVNEKATHMKGDLSSFDFCKKAVTDMDFVFHIAGIKGSVDVTVKKPASFFVPLVMMNTNLLEAARLGGIKKLVYASSIGAYASGEIFREDNAMEGSPMDMFPGWAKRMAELQIQAYKIQYGLDSYAVVRPCNVYGPGDNFDPKNAMVIPSLMHRIFHKEDPLVIWGDGSAVRDFAFSEDVADGTILALVHGTSSGFVNLGSGNGYTLKELVETLHSFIDFNYRFDASKPSGFPKRVMDISLAKKTIHYNPKTTLKEGLSKTWNWYIKHPDEHQKKQNYFKE